MSARSRSALPLAVLFVLGCGSGSSSPTGTSAQLWADVAEAPCASAALRVVDGLDDGSTYRSRLAHDGSPSDRVRDLGAFGLGNRIVFATVGLTSPLNTVHGAMGPGYGKEQRFFGDHALHVVRAGTGAALAEVEEWAERVRGTAIVRTHARLDAGVLLETLDVAPWTGSLDDPERRAIVRLALVTATADTPELELVSRPVWSVQEGGAFLEERNGSRRMRVHFLAPGARTEDGELKLALGPMRRGEQRAVPVVYAFGRNPNAGAHLDETLRAIEERGLEELFEASRERWLAFTSGGTQFRTPDPKVNDLIDGMRVTLKVQQSRFGATTPMSLYTGSWLRDIIGPLRFFTQTGRADEARVALDYYYGAVRYGGDITNSVLLGLDPAAAPPPPDWSALPTFDGRERAESPSYQVLAYHRLFKLTGETERIDERWGFLRRCLDGQAFEGDLLPFSGDETFRVAMAFAFGLNPILLFEEEAFSANSAFLFVAAAEALAEMGDATGRGEEASELRAWADRVRASTEQAYRQDDGLYGPLIYRDDMRLETRPFEDVNLKPFWTGYASPDDPAALRNLRRTVELLGRPNGTIQTPIPPGSSRFLIDLLGLTVEDGVFTGMVPGYSLHELAVTDHPQAELAFNAIDLTVLSSGNWGEYMVSDDYSALSYHDGTGVQGNYTARYRPWEGGINLDAMLTFLWGLEPDAPRGALRLAPRLPNAWPWSEARGVRVGDRELDLRVERDGDEIRYRFEHRGGGALALDLEIRAGSRELVALTLDGAAIDPGTIDRLERWGRTAYVVRGIELGAGEARRLRAELR